MHSRAYNSLVRQTVIPNSQHNNLAPVYAYVGVTIDTARNSQNQRDRMVDDIIGLTDKEWMKIKSYMEKRAFERVAKYGNLGVVVCEKRLAWICELDTLRVFHE